MRVQDQAQQRATLKRRITLALGKKLDRNGMGFLRRADNRGANGFHYDIARSESGRVGVEVRYRAVTLWRDGKYDEAYRVNAAQTFYLAAVLVEAGFTVSVTGRSNEIPSVVVWADENEPS